MGYSKVILDLENYKPCPEITLVKFTWDSRKKDEGKIYYCLGNKPKLKIFKVYFISNYSAGKIILNDDIPESVCASKLENYRKINRAICCHTETELKKLADFLTLEKPYVEQAPASKFFD